MNKKLIAAFTLALLVLSSCQYEIIGDPGTPGGTGGDFNLHLTLDKIDSDHATVSRSTIPPTTDEEKVQNLALLFFAQTTDASGELKGAILLQDGPYQMNKDIPISFSGSDLDPNTPYNILIVGNANEMYLGFTLEDWVANLSGQTEQQVYDQSIATLSGAADNKETDDSHAIRPGEILMTSRATRAGGQTLVSATMLRTLARFDVINSKPAEYNLVSASIWNAYPESSVFNSGTMDYSLDRLKRFYGVKNPADDYSNILGGLYAFTNRVASPAQDDELTTCLIVGLAPTADKNFGGTTWPAGEVKYFRANINATGSAQALKRNNAYKLTIRDVIGPGEDDEDGAYSGGSNNLSYIINYWDLDDDGLIVFDDDNLLAIPTKTAKLDPKGETRELSIFTFGEGTLSIKNQNFGGSSAIHASLNGNTLTIVAQPLGGELERTGFIELSFAKLTATINVIQNPKGDRFLEVITPTGSGIPAFDAGANATMEGMITINASGPWTAMLYMDGFSFRKNQSVKTLNSSEVPDNAFTLFTESQNDGTQLREAFLLIRLNEDPDNFNSVLLLTQKADGSISTKPDVRTVTFLANGELDLSESTIQEFNVYPTVEDKHIYPWKAEILPYGNDTPVSDAHLFEFYDPSTGTVGDIQTSDTEVEGNRVGVKPVGPNNTVNVLKAKLRISLVDEPDKFTEIELIQNSQNISHTPENMKKVSVKGGMSDVISLIGNESITWTATVNTTTTTGGKTLKLHDAVIVDEGGTVLDTSNPLPITQKFRVKFPKVYFPNSDKAILANVEIRVTGSTVTHPIAVEQEMLTARAIVPGSMFSGYGSIGPTSDYFLNFREMLINRTVFGPGKRVPLGPVALPTSNIGIGKIPQKTNYLHANTTNADYSTNTFKNINTWMENEGVLVVSTDMDMGQNSLFTDAASKFKQWNIKRNGTLIGAANKDGRTMNATNAARTRIGQYLTAKGPYVVTNTQLDQFYGDGVSAAVNLTGVMGGGAPVAIIGITNNKVGLFVDPVNRVVFIGESQFFSRFSPGLGTGAPGNDYDRFLANLVTYIFYTAAYGSHFSDLLIDGSPLPAPWDAAWGN